jgi:branched-chain amino acid transport system ATP-binding protein
VSELLRTESLRKRFGELIAVDEVSLSFQEGILTSIIGPNGAGKTTLINLLTGSLPSDSGKILFRGEDITRLPTEKRVRRGISRSFQIMNMFYPV